MDGASGKDRMKASKPRRVPLSEAAITVLRVSAEGRMEPDRSNCADLPRPEA
jgi:hypothetical protein